jgi:hypothetical protein
MRFFTANPITVDEDISAVHAKSKTNAAHEKRVMPHALFVSGVFSIRTLASSNEES